MNGTPHTLLAKLNLIAIAPNGVAKLRELILTLAVQGKLVPQDASDEPASELLKKIRAEKDRLIAEGKIKREKPLPEIAEDEKPFELPVGWEWVRLGALLPFRIGKTPPSKDPRYWAANGHAWVSISDMEHFGEIRATHRTITDKGAAVFGYDPLPIGTLIMSFKLTIGKIAVLQIPAYHNEAIISFQPLAGLDTEFLKFSLPTVSKTGASKNALMGQTLNTESLSNLIMAVPPTAEQSRIVARVAELMRLCDALEAKGRLEATQHAQLVARLLAGLTACATAEELAERWQRVAEHFDLLFDRPEAVDALEQTILQLAVRGLLVPQDPNDEPASELLKKIRAEKDRLIAEGKIKRDKPLPPISEDEKPFELPQGWEWTRMQTAFDVRDGTHDTPKYVERDGVPLITSKSFEGGKINFENAKLISVSDHESIMKRSKVERNDILYSMIGGNIGNQVIVDTDREFSIKNVALFKCVSVALTQPHFLHLFLETATLTMQERAVGGAQPFVSLSLLRNIPFPLPPTAQQSRIVARVTSLRALCADLRERLTAARVAKSRFASAAIASA